MSLEVGGPSVALLDTMTDDLHSLAALFVHHLRRGEPGPEPLGTADVEKALAAALAAARVDWPTVLVPPERFVRHLAARLEGAPENAAAILASCEHFADLYLACACAEGNPAALAAFEARCLPGIGAVAVRIGSSGVTGDEIEQALRDHLFVGRGARPPAIAEYLGRGPLASWVFVVATRLALNLMRGRDKPGPERDEKLLDLPAPDADQELAYLKRLYQTEFAAALRDGLGTLSARDRTLLRQHYIDGVTLKQLANVCGVHRVTMVHWVERARDALRNETHRLLLERLGVTEGTLDSIARLVRSQFISLDRALKDEPEPETPR